MPDPNPIKSPAPPDVWEEIESALDEEASRLVAAAVAAIQDKEAEADDDAE